MGIFTCLHFDVEREFIVKVHLSGLSKKAARARTQPSRSNSCQASPMTFSDCSGHRLPILRLQFQLLPARSG